MLLPICFACSNDESTSAANEPSFEEKIMGTWQLIDRIPNGIEFCERSNILRFSPHNDFFIELNISNDVGGCRSASVSGTWTYLGNNQVEINLEKVEGNSIFEITFSNNARILKLVDDSIEDISTKTYTKQ